MQLIGDMRDSLTILGRVKEVASSHRRARGDTYEMMRLDRYEAMSLCNDLYMSRGTQIQCGLHIRGGQTGSNFLVYINIPPVAFCKI